MTDQFKLSSDMFLICVNCKDNIPLIKHYVQNSEIYLEINCSCSEKIQRIKFSDYLKKLYKIYEEKIDTSQLISIKCDLHNETCYEYCEKCQLNICNSCKKYHENTHITKKIQDFKYSANELDEYNKSLKKAENNCFKNNLLVKDNLIEEINREINKLKNQKKLLEASFAKNNDLNRQLYSLVTCIYSNFIKSSSPNFNYNSYVNFKNNTLFNITKINLPPDSNLELNIKRLRYFFRYNHLTRAKIGDIKLSQTIKDHEGSIKAICRIKGGYIATGGSDKKINLYGGETFQKFDELVGHKGTITSLITVNQSLYSSYLISSSEDKTIKIWKFEQDDEEIANKLQNTFFNLNNSDIKSVKSNVSKDSKTNNVIGAQSSKSLKKYLPNELIVNNGVKTEGNEILNEKKYPKLVLFSTILAHKGCVSKVIKYNEDQIISCSWDKTIKIWEIDTGANLLTIDENDKDVNSIILLSDGRIVSGGKDKIIKFWEITYNKSYDYKLVQEMKGILSTTANSITQISATDIAIGGFKTITIIDIYKYETVKIINAHSLWINVIKTLTNGFIVSGSMDQTIKMWDIHLDQSVMTINEKSIINDLEITQVKNDPNCIISGLLSGYLNFWIEE